MGRAASSGALAVTVPESIVLAASSAGAALESGEPESVASAASRAGAAALQPETPSAAKSPTHIRLATISHPSKPMLLTRVYQSIAPVPRARFAATGRGFAYWAGRWAALTRTSGRL